MKTELPSLGQYTLKQALERDSTNEVWRAYDSRGQRTVVVKFFHTDVSDTADALTNYVHYIERIVALHHPNIVRIHDLHILPHRRADDDTSMMCLVMQDIQGESLADYIHNTSAAGKFLPPVEIVNLFTTIALTIDAAHQQGIIHGNLKPTNILLDHNGVASPKVGKPLLTGFGSSQLLPQRKSHDMPFYLAPEQINGEPADERSDIYALGVILYELSTGVPPFRGNRPIAVMMQHINATPTPPDLFNPTLSPALMHVILRCLEKDPNRRFPNVASLAAALVNALQAVPDDAILGNASTIPEPTKASRSSVSTAHFKRRHQSNFLIVTVSISLVLLLLLITAYALLPSRQQQSPALPALVGHAFFINSGQLAQDNYQGINDELQIDLSHLPAPAAGKSYYAWLLGDLDQTEAPQILLGSLRIENGNVHLLYSGDTHHADLLGTFSRLLITEDDAHNPSSNPLLIQSTWRYYAVLSQTPNPTDKLHFSMLDHLRHLLVESPELAIRGLHGGLALWYVKNTVATSNLANNLVGEWKNQNALTIHDQLVSILDYLDGASFVTADVPSGTPLLADAHDVQVGLLGPSPQDADPPGYVYQDESPPGYTYLVEEHMNGAILSPQTTSQQRQLAIKISEGLQRIQHALAQASQDAKQLVRLTAGQLLAPASLTVLNDLAAQLRYAYIGSSQSSTATSSGGVFWIYASLQSLATFDIAPYVMSK